MTSPSATDSKWWQEAVIYQIYPRSFFDSNGDGEGDLPGITQKLQYIADLGVDAIWLSPFFTSPNKDGGYDVANPRDVDPRFGNLADAKLMINKAHDLGLKVLVDIVPNHFSSEHEWFKAALAAGAGSKERARFHFLDGKDDGTPPNNWISLFGGPAWTQVADGQYYLHLFDSSQPDLNWENPEVDEDFKETISFWVKMGVDGFRIDVAHGLVKENILADHHDPQGLSDALRIDVDMEIEKREALLASVPFFDRTGVHEIYRSWRKHFDSFDKPIMAVAEAWVHPPVNGVAYVRPDELHQIFNFDLLIAPFSAKTLFRLIDNTIEMLKGVDAYPTWAISNHDSHVLRLDLALKLLARWHFSYLAYLALVIFITAKNLVYLMPSWPIAIVKILHLFVQTVKLKVAMVLECQCLGLAKKLPLVSHRESLGYHFQQLGKT